LKRKGLESPNQVTTRNNFPIEKGFFPKKMGLNSSPNQLPYGGTSQRRRGLGNPNLMHKDSLRKAPFCSNKLFPRELHWGYHLVLSPTRKVFFSFEEVVRRSNLVGISTFFFSSYNFVEYSKFFSPWATWLDIPNPLLS
jgi:hypothetical protein